ncbi:MAG: hypothetical protein ACFCD0_26250 [Gemmataceae bacterium]
MCFDSQTDCSNFQDARISELFAKPHEVAEGIAFHPAAQASSITGSVMVADAGYTACTTSWSVAPFPKVNADHCRLTQ